jgi:hypothetical protein
VLAALAVWLVFELADKMRRKTLTLQNTIITFPPLMLSACSKKNYRISGKNAFSA